MFFDTITITNTTEEAIQLGPVELLPAEPLALFVASDLSTYDRSLWVMLYGLDLLFSLWEAGSVLVEVNGQELTAEGWAMVKDRISVILATASAGYHGQAFTFDMKTKRLKIVDPLTGDTYEIQATKVSQ